MENNHDSGIFEVKTKAWEKFLEKSSKFEGKLYWTQLLERWIELINYPFYKVLQLECVYGFTEEIW